MTNLNVLGLLGKYQTWVDRGEIQFLNKGSPQQKTVLKLLRDIISDFAKAAERPGGLSTNLDWYEAHKQGKKLYHALASYSLNSIDPSSKGNARLYQFLDVATEFEDILYGLETYYRDHTLHSLWVYFIGEYILREHLQDVHNDLNWYLYNDIERDKSLYKRTLVDEARRKYKALLKKVNTHRDAIWCIMALCHDLGYSIEKLTKLNQKVRNVLGFLDLRGIPRVGYTLNLEHQHLTSQLLELMSVDVRIVPSGDERTPLIKLYMYNKTYWLLCRSLEKRQHGVLSSYLIYKILGIFADACVRGPGEEWGLEDDEVISNLIRGDILFGIAQHRFDFSYLEELGSLADILILADELEEFSRFGRPMLSRKYHDTIAESSIAFKRSKPRKEKEIQIHMSYEVAPAHSLDNFFQRKAERLSQVYALYKYDTYTKSSGEGVYRIKRIIMEAKKNGQHRTFSLSRDSITARLPSTTIDGKAYREAEYHLTFRDDDLFIQVEDQQVSMHEWFLNETQ